MKRDPFSIFNVNEFEKWMQDSTPPKLESTIGATVTSKVSFKKLRVVSEALDNEKAIIEFHRNGGTILEEDKDMLTIKTKKGSFKVSKSYININ